VDPETGRLPPSRVAVFLAGGVLVGCVAYAGVAFGVNEFYGAMIGFPVLVGTIVGTLTKRRPLRSFAWMLVVLCVACGLWALVLGSYALYALFYLTLPVPGLLTGVLCGHTLRRFARARAFQRFLRVEAAES
jgi:hypothetical protein